MWSCETKICMIFLVVCAVVMVLAGGLSLGVRVHSADSEKSIYRCLCCHQDDCLQQEDK